MSKKLAIVLKFAAAVICCVLASTAAHPQQSAPRAGEAYTQGLLWRVERAGAPPSHVFGTVHVADPRVTALAPEVRKSFDGASVVTLADARGKVRLRMVVDSAGPAKIEFLNDSGRVVHAIPSP